MQEQEIEIPVADVLMHLRIDATSPCVYKGHTMNNLPEFSGDPARIIAAIKGGYCIIEGKKESRQCGTNETVLVCENGEIIEFYAPWHGEQAIEEYRERIAHWMMIVHLYEQRPFRLLRAIAKTRIAEKKRESLKLFKVKHAATLAALYPIKDWEEVLYKTDGSVYAARIQRKCCPDSPDGLFVNIYDDGRVEKFRWQGFGGPVLVECG